MHEEYLACLIESVISGSSAAENIKREKISRILRARPSIAKRLRDARSEKDGITIFSAELDRVHMIVEKIARGHVLYELNELVADPVELIASPLSMLTPEDHQNFENGDDQHLDVWPEVGSRSMQRLLVADDAVYHGWIEVQKDRYRYTVSQPGGIEVRMVFSEYLACRVAWD